MKTLRQALSPRSLIPAASSLALWCLPLSAQAAFVQTNLVSNIAGLAAHTDPNLKNPWGISASATSPFWISNNGTGISTLYNGQGVPFPVATPLIVTVPPPAGGTPPSTPTGQVFNGGASFQVGSNLPARFIFATEDGTISGWNPTANPTSAILKVDNSVSGAVYKGLAIGNNGSADFLYAANFTAGKIDVFDSAFSSTTLSGNFTDPNLPAGYKPFNVQNINGKLLVTYALADAGDPAEDSPGAGNGYVDVFDLNGTLERRLVSGGALNSPWGLAMAPSNFGEFANDLLVGNFGDGKINAFDPLTGDLLGQIVDSTGNAIVNEGLWGLQFGNGGNGGDTNKLYFTAGINDEADGLFGSLTVPEPGSLALIGGVLVTWLAGRRNSRTGKQRTG